MVFDRPASEPHLVWHTPEPATFWIDAAPRAVRPSEGLWIDPRTRDLFGVGRRPTLARARPPYGPTTVYATPAYDGASDISGDLAAWCEAAGVALLRQVGGGTAPEEPEATLIDALEPVVDRRWDDLAKVAAGAIVLWPLLPGVGDSEEALSEGLGALTEAPPSAVVGLLLDLAGRSRRRLAERFGEPLFDALFHPRPPRPRRFAAACRERDLEFLPPRQGGGEARRLERAIAAELGRIADLLTGLGASPAEAQRFYRAARWIEATPHDLANLVEQGNLGLVPAIDDEIERTIGELVEGAERSTKLAEMAGRWADVTAEG